MAVPTDQQILDALKTEVLNRIEGKSGSDFTIQTAGGLRRLKTMEGTELMNWLQLYENKVAKSAVAASGSMQAFADMRRPK